MRLGLQEEAPGGGFVRPRCALGRRMRTDGRDLAGCIVAQAGRAAVAPAQAHVAAWVAERACEGARPGWMSFWAEKRKE